MCQHRPVSLYDQLGVDPAADDDELKAAYRQRARALHPDLNRSPDAGAAMSRLNEAWAILGDPDARRQYDESLRAPESPRHPPVPVAPRPSLDSDVVPGGLPWAWLFRPSVLLPLVLLIIFVVTAYAAHPGSGGSPTSVTTTTTASVNLVGGCIVNQPTSVLVVPCSETPNSLVVAVVPAQVSCPAGTTGLSLDGQPEMVCAQPYGR